jgi:hypothetical protein
MLYISILDLHFLALGMQPASRINCITMAGILNHIKKDIHKCLLLILTSCWSSPPPSPLPSPPPRHRHYTVWWNSTTLAITPQSSTPIWSKMMMTKLYSKHGYEAIVVAGLYISGWMVKKWSFKKEWRTACGHSSSPWLLINGFLSHAPRDGSIYYSVQDQWLSGFG